MTQHTGSAVYVYCLIRAPRRPRLTRVPTGVPGATPPELHDLGGSIWLVASVVPLDIYRPDELEPRLHDLDWVASVAVAHEAVNEHFARMRGPVVVPMKLFTMFSSHLKAAKDVRARRVEIARVMRRVAGCEEWGIRVTHRPLVPERDGPAGPRPISGAQFLQARKAAREAAARARTNASSAADSAFERLKRVSKDAHRRPRGSEAGTNPPILEAAFLVRTTARARFKTEARRQAPLLAKAGADLALTGPWPAYNFVGREA